MKIIHIKEPTPLMGAITFGIIDRGTNLIQVRCTSVCNLNCEFCFTDAGTTSKNHQVEYIVDKDHLLNWTKKVIKWKGIDNIEINLDSAGEMTTYKDLLPLVQDIKKIPEVSFISMQCNGALLTKELIDNLEKAGLNRINLSLHTLNPQKARKIMGCSFYNMEKMKDLARYLANSSIDLELAPVYMKNINDEDMPDLIKFAKEINAKILIQNYLTYKNSRQMQGVQKVNWFKFYRQLTQWEKEFDIKLKYGPNDFKITRTKKLPLVVKKGETIYVEIVEQGWLHNEMLAVYKDRLITVENCKKNIGDRVKIKITSTKDAIYKAKKA